MEEASIDLPADLDMSTALDVFWIERTEQNRQKEEDLDLMERNLTLG